MIVDLNKKAYRTKIYGRGIYGRVYKIKTQKGNGIVDTLGKSATKYILGGIGKSSGNYLGKQLGRMVQEKTGSELLGKVAKAGLSSLGGVAGQQLGNVTGRVLANTVFSNDEEKKKKENSKPKVSLNQLLDQARQKISGQQANGINLIQ